MKSELKLLNLLCALGAVAFIVMALLNILVSGAFLSTDNLFITMVCLVMAVMFGAMPLMYLKSEGRLPIPFQKRRAMKAAERAAIASQSTPPLLDSRGRAVPADVKSMVNRMKAKQP